MRFRVAQITYWPDRINETYHREIRLEAVESTQTRFIELREVVHLTEEFKEYYNIGQEVEISVNHV